MNLPASIRRRIEANPQMGAVRFVVPYTPTSPLIVGVFGACVLLCALSVYLAVPEKQWILLAIVLVLCLALTAWVYKAMHSWMAVCDRGIVMGAQFPPFTMLTMTEFHQIIPLTFVCVHGITSLFIMGKRFHNGPTWGEWGIIFCTPPASSSKKHLVAFKFVMRHNPSGVAREICHIAAQSGYPQLMSSPAFTQPPTDLDGARTLPTPLGFLSQVENF